MTPRTVRNNNPGDIRTGQSWLGLMHPADMNEEQRAEPDFCVFRAPSWGFRALAILLHNYQTVSGLQTINQFIARFAPTNENSTAMYAGHVAWECGVGAGQPYDLSVRSNLSALIKAIAKYETGSWAPYWTDAQLDEGIDLSALFLPAETV